MLRELKSWFGGKKSPRSTPRSRPSVRPALEALEDRVLMAADVTATLGGGVLHVTGNSQAASITLTQHGQTLTVQEQVYVSQQGPGYVIGGISVDSGSIGITTKTVGTFSANQVRSVALAAGAGDKVINIDPSVQTQRVEVDAGSGNDTLCLVAGRDKIMAGTGRGTVNVTIDPVRYLNPNAPYALVSANVQYGGTLAKDTFNVYLDVGSFGSTVVRQGISEVQSALAIFQPLVNTLNSPIPVISALSEQVGGPAYTWKDVFDIFVGGSGDRALNTFLQTYNAIESFNPNSLSGSVFLGRFGAATPTRIQNYARVNPLAQNRALNSLTNRLANLGLHLDILTDPSQAMKLLLGQTASLIRYDGPSFSVQSGSFGYDYQIPVAGIFSVDVGYSGTLGASAGISLGLDSSGLYYHNVLDGFHIIRAYAQLTSSISVSGGVAVGVPDFITIGKVYGQATLSGTLTASLSNYYPLYTSSSIGKAVHYSGSLDASGGVYVSYTKAIEDLGNGNIIGAVIDAIRSENHTDTVFTLPPWHIARFGS
jgi:hypothetical protein